MMLDCDRISEGWQIWLTPRQTRILFCKMTRGRMRKEDKTELKKLVEWFEREVELKKFRR
ncbi:MAG: hypothetical protein V3573_14460 [Desulfovibrionaceae bacterium]